MPFDLKAAIHDGLCHFASRWRTAKTRGLSTPEIAAGRRALEHAMVEGLPFRGVGNAEICRQ